ncbi:hypothetical protein [Streptomyces sp. NPDC045714]|uniref:hypothetical protein n=1 Tax=Streptomyces sp. NPDC045714 TaxID=3154913 RepID=UPI0033DB6DC0
MREEPRLSVLVVTHLGRPLSYLGDVLSRLGAAEPASEFARQQWAAAEAPKPQPVEKKDSSIRKIRRLLGEVDRPHRQRPAQDLCG